MQFKPVSLKNRRIRIRALFTPTTPDAVLLHAKGKNTGLLGIYLVKGEVVLARRRNQARGAKPTIIEIGKAILDKPNQFTLRLEDGKTLKGHFNGQPFPNTPKLTAFIIENAPLDIRIGGPTDKPLTGEALPGFTGEIHFLSIAAASPPAKVSEKEKAAWDGKIIRFAPKPEEVPQPLVPKINK